MVDFREEEVVLVRSFEDEYTEADNRSDCFPGKDGEETEGDLCFRDVVGMEGAVESCRREVTLVSVALVEGIRFVGSTVSRVFLGGRGDFEGAAAESLATFSTFFWGSGLVSPGRASAPIF